MAIGYDPDARLPSGLTWRDGVRLAADWWDRTGRHLARNPEFRDADVGFPSGLLRGLEWEHLTGEERLTLVRTWDATQAAALTVGAPPPAPRPDRRIIAVPAGESRR